MHRFDAHVFDVYTPGLRHIRCIHIRKASRKLRRPGKLLSTQVPYTPEDTPESLTPKPDSLNLQPGFQKGSRGTVSDEPRSPVHLLTRSPSVCLSRTLSLCLSPTLSLSVSHSHSLSLCSPLHMNAKCTMAGLQRVSSQRSRLLAIGAILWVCIVKNWQYLQN